MPDGAGSAPIWAEEFRQILAGRRKRRARLAIAALAAVGAGAIAAPAVRTPPVILVWNASPSAPVGLYRLSRGRPITRGTTVIARLPERARRLAAERHYLPANVPLVKRAAALGGDRVCALGSIISVNGVATVTRRRADPKGRPMPWWSGCRRLAHGHYFLLTEDPLSFDGRYVGVTADAEILGRAELLWAY